MSRNWHLTASLRGGTPAMRLAARLYLPQEPGESEEAYKNRLDRSVLTNLYKKTSDKLVGKPLKKPIVAEEDIPAEIKFFWDDVDNQGTNMDVFARSIFESAVDDGVTHILVDFSNTAEITGDFPGGSITLEQQRDFGVRPFSRHIRAHDLIGWKSETVNGVRRLVQVRITETVKVDVDEFNQEERLRIRVIEPQLIRVYEKVEREDEKGQKQEDWILIEASQNTLGVIPLVTFYTNKTGFMQGEPWLQDVGHLNVAHWQSDSDQRNILHIARIPILFAVGFGDDDSQIQIEIGSNSFVKAPKGATLTYVEHTGKGVESGFQDLKDLEERIQLLGMEMLVKRPSGNVTATARALDQVEADSDLGLISRELENALESMLDLFGDWLNLGADSGGTVSVFTDFGIQSEDKKDIELLLKARAQGDISHMTFLRELKRRGLLSDDFNPQDEIDLLDLESGGSAGAAPEEGATVPADEGAQDDEAEGAKGRNRPGDTTSESDGHRHVLQEGGTTDEYVDPESGESHSHTWDEMAIRTSVEDGHSHILLARAAAGTGQEQDPIELMEAEASIAAEAAAAAAAGGQGNE